MGEREESILLCAAGDLALGGSLEGRLNEAREAAMAGVRPLFAAGDLGFANLDCTFDVSGQPPHPQEYLVAAPPEQLELLVELGIDVVSLANNHSMDYGGESLERSRDHLRRLGIEGVGAGRNLSAARAACRLERKGVRVGFLAYASTHPWVGAIPATAEGPGVAPLEPAMMREDLQILRPTVDCVVISVHWGKENLHYPPPAHLELGRQLIDWGADLVLGHHPHVVQGMEERGRGLIFYSLGNFLFPDFPGQGLTFAGEQQESLVVLIRLSAQGAKLERVVPVHFDEEGRVAVLEGERKAEIERQLRTYSTALQRQDYSSFWQAQVRRAELRRLWRVFDQEVVQAGWRRGTRRLLRLGRKNLLSLGRSLVEILGATGQQGR